MRYATAGVLALFAATASVAVADEVFVVAAAANYPTVWPALNDALGGVESLVFGAVGVLVIVRRGNTVGWLMSALGLLVAVMTATGSYARVLSPTPDATLTGPFWLAPWWLVVGGFAWLFAITLLAVFIQVFPDGRPLSPRWRLPLLLTVAWPAVFLAVDTFSPVNARGLPNPSGLSGPLGDVMLALGVALVPLTVLITIAAVASVLLRYRRAAGRQRAQLKWFAYGAAVTLGSLALGGLLLPTEASYVANGLAICGLPLSVAAAILRNGLYDIDVVIERTLVYGATTAAIAIAFFGAIVVLQAILRPLIGGSELAVAGSTLLSFALFQPVRRRIQRVVDRRFYRSRYDAGRTVDDFSVRLRDEVDLEAVRAGLLDAVDETMRPTHASLWLRQSRNDSRTLGG